MEIIYCVVRPHPQKDNSWFHDIRALTRKSYHELMYEHVCGYSLGYPIIFYESFHSATTAFNHISQSGKSFFSPISQKAIVKLELDNGKIIGFSSIYRPKYWKLGSNAYLPVWDVRSIDKSDSSTNALDEINRQYIQTYPPERISIICT